MAKTQISIRKFATAAAGNRLALACNLSK